MDGERMGSAGNGHRGGMICRTNRRYWGLDNMDDVNVDNDVAFKVRQTIDDQFF